MDTSTKAWSSIFTFYVRIIFSLPFTLKKCGGFLIPEGYFDETFN